MKKMVYVVIPLGVLSVCGLAFAGPLDNADQFQRKYMNQTLKRNEPGKVRGRTIEPNNKKPSIVVLKDPVNIEVGPQEDDKLENQ